MPDFSKELVDQLVQREIAKDPQPVRGQEEQVPAQTLEKKGLSPWLMGGIFAGNMLDAESTRRFRDYENKMGLDNGEANPLAKTLVNNTPAMFGVKAGSSALQSWLFDKLSESGHPNIAKAAAIGAAALPGFVGFNNIRNVNRWKNNNPNWREGIRGK